jgi:hypothetical protein
MPDVNLVKTAFRTFFRPSCQMPLPPPHMMMENHVVPLRAIDARHTRSEK